jgi:pimeloyl-ACP methyl ester carboxylesterase
MRATLKDTRRYFANEGGKAVIVRRMVADALLEAWHADRRVMLIGHSLGSVIAFDVLWELSHRFSVPGRVDLFVTIGSPLGLSFVRSRLLGAREQGRRRFPTNIRRWQNFAAVGEMTALDRALATAWGDMREAGLVEAISDRMDLQTWFRGPEGLNVHKCYGYMVNPVLGAAVAEWWKGG